MKISTHLVGFKPTVYVENFNKTLISTWTSQTNSCVVFFQQSVLWEGPRLAQHIRDKTPTIESLYTHNPEEQRNYSQAWNTWQDDPVQEPIRRRVGAKSKASGEFVAKGAAPSASDRSTSVGSWVGRDLLPPPKKGKGSSKGEESSTTPVWKPSLRGSSPAVLPLSAKVKWVIASMDEIEVDFYTDCRSLEEHVCQPGLHTVTDKRLAIDLSGIRQQIWRQQGEEFGDPLLTDWLPSGGTTRLLWTSTDRMVVDCMTKAMKPGSLCTVMDGAETCLVPTKTKECENEGS